MDEATRLAIKRMTDAELDEIIASGPEGRDWWESLTDRQLAALAAGWIPMGLPPLTDKELPR
jgi:hypothetical protein